jgi:dienelactone hydrolase
MPVDTGQFALFSLLRQATPAPALTVYIEGDGAPWPTVFHPPRDPTPLQPLALLLAASDPAPAVAYLARPCQYRADGSAAACDPAYWTDRRFAPEVLAATDLALTRLKQVAGARRLRLVGFSGGGVIAALLASRRDDVDALVTVAAPLALGAWVNLHRMSPLAAADPLTDSPDRRLPPAVHFVGADDELVPAGIVRRFASVRGGRLEVVPGFDHDGCWARDWPQLLRRVPAMEN